MSCVIERELALIQKLSGKAAKTGNLQFLKIEVTVYNNTALCVWGEEIILVIKETTDFMMRKLRQRELQVGWERGKESH